MDPHSKTAPWGRLRERVKSRVGNGRSIGNHSQNREGSRAPDGLLSQRPYGAGPSAHICAHATFLSLYGADHAAVRTDSRNCAMDDISCPERTPATNSILAVVMTARAINAPDLDRGARQSTARATLSDAGAQQIHGQSRFDPKAHQKSPARKRGG